MDKADDCNSEVKIMLEYMKPPAGMEEISKRIKSREFSELRKRENIDDMAKVIALYRAVRMNRNDRLTDMEIELLKKISADKHYVIARALVTEFIHIAKNVEQVIPRATIRTLSKITACVGVLSHAENITTPLVIDVLVLLTHKWLQDLGMGWDAKQNRRLQVNWACVTGLSYAFLWRIPARWSGSTRAMIAAELSQDFWTKADVATNVPHTLIMETERSPSGTTTGTERAIARLPEVGIAAILTSPADGDDYLMIVRNESPVPTKSKLLATAFMELSRLAFPRKGEVQTRCIAQRDTLMFNVLRNAKYEFRDFSTFNEFFVDTMLRSLLAQLDKETYYVYKDDMHRRIKPTELEMKTILLLVEQIRSLQNAFFDEDLHLPKSGEHLQDWYKERYSITKLTGRHLHEQHSFNNLYSGRIG